MALPVAHIAIASGAARQRSAAAWIVLAICSILPDFDFFLVWIGGYPIFEAHRTFSHSLLFAVAVALLYGRLRPARWPKLPARLLFAVTASHALLDMLCTADALQHGVQWLWPLSTTRWGWPVLVPLYRLFAESPFSISGALRFTILELLLAFPLYLLARALRPLWGETAAEQPPVLTGSRPAEGPAAGAPIPGTLPWK